MPPPVWLHPLLFLVTRNYFQPQSSHQCSTLLLFKSSYSHLNSTSKLSFIISHLSHSSSSSPAAMEANHWLLFVSPDQTWRATFVTSSSVWVTSSTFSQEVREKLSWCESRPSFLLIRNYISRYLHLWLYRSKLHLRNLNIWKSKSGCFNIFNINKSIYCRYM